MFFYVELSKKNIKHNLCQQTCRFLSERRRLGQWSIKFSLFSDIQKHVYAQSYPMLLHAQRTKSVESYCSRIPTNGANHINGIVQSDFVTLQYLSVFVSVGGKGVEKSNISILNIHLHRFFVGCFFSFQRKPWLKNTEIKCNYMIIFTVFFFTLLYFKNIGFLLLYFKYYIFSIFYVVAVIAQDIGLKI